MKIAIVRTSNGSLDPHKYNVQEIGLGKSLIKLGVNVDLYSTFNSITSEVVFDRGESARLKLIPINGYCVKQITFYPNLIKKVLREDYDFIQVHEDSQLMGPLILSAAKDKGIKTILYQGMYKNFSGLGRIYQFIFDFFFKEKIKNNIDFIFAKTNEAKDYLNKKGYVNVEVRPIGLDFVKEQDSYSDFETIVRLKNKFQHLALYVGILEKRRDIIFLLEVLKELLALNNSLYLGFIIVGKGADLFKVKERIKDLELTDNVLIIDSVPNNEIGDIYKSCDLFLLPTHYEIYGMVVMEALYYGIPVISSRTAGPLDILKDLYLGQTIEMNKEIWMNTITKYLDSFKNKGEYKTKRKDFIISNYSWDNLAYNYLKEIKQIVG